MDTENTRVGHDTSALAHSLDCLTEAELCALGKLKQSTAEAWRKRGVGPEYVRLGNAFLYPRPALAEFLRGRVRKRSAVDPLEVL